MKYQNHFIILGLLLFVMACKSTNPDYQKDANKADIIHRSVKQLTDIIVHDIFSPPVASRNYVYPSVAAYEVLVQDYPDYKSIISKHKAPKVILYSSEFILIGENFYNVKLIERIIKKIRDTTKHKKLFFSYKKNISYFNKNFGLSFSQLKDILHKLNFKKDKENPVKYVLKENNIKMNNYIKSERKNSPFAILKKLSIN